MFKNAASLQLNLDALPQGAEQVMLAIDEGTPDISWIYDIDFSRARPRRRRRGREGLAARPAPRARGHPRRHGSSRTSRRRSSSCVPCPSPTDHTKTLRRQLRADDARPPHPRLPRPGEDRVSADALRLVHLYPEELGVSGDRGNVDDAGRARARRAGLDTEVVEYRVGRRRARPWPTSSCSARPALGAPCRQHRRPAPRCRPSSGFADVRRAGRRRRRRHGAARRSGVVTGEGETSTASGSSTRTARRGAPRRTNYFQVDDRLRRRRADALRLREPRRAPRARRRASSRSARVVHGGGNGPTAREGVVRGASFGTQLQGPRAAAQPGADATACCAPALHAPQHLVPPGSAHAKLDEYAAQSRAASSARTSSAPFKAM